jgi:hypothetical protein
MENSPGRMQLLSHDNPGDCERRPQRDNRTAELLD